MGHRRILSFCLAEIDRLTRANQLFEAAIVRMRDSATAPLFVDTLGEQLAVNTRIGLALHRLHQALNHAVSPAEDAGASGLAAEAMHATELEDTAVRDVAMAQAAVRIDHWQIAGYTGLHAFLRQVFQDEAADEVEAILGLLGVADAHLEALRPSLTALSKDEERHGHDTRSPEDRTQHSQLVR